MLEIELAGLELAEVQDVVDDMQQGMAAALRGLEIAAGFGIERTAQCEFRMAEEAVDGRPDLVAHIREELALGFRCGHRIVAGLRHGGVRDLQLFLVGLQRAGQLGQGVGLPAQRQRERRGPGRKRAEEDPGEHQRHRAEVPAYGVEIPRGRDVEHPVPSADSELHGLGAADVAGGAVAQRLIAVVEQTQGVAVLGVEHLDPGL